MIAGWILVAALAQQPGVDPNAPLPPGHPALNDGALPPGHPTFDNKPAGPLPPGHPPIGSSSSSSSSEPMSSSAAPMSGGPLPAGHPQVDPNQKPMSASELIQKLDATPDLRTKAKTFDVATALGKLYYSSARYPDAIVYLRQAMEKTAGIDAARVVDAERVLANALFLTGDGAGALTELDKAVARDERDPEAAFLRGAVRLDQHGDDVKALALSKKDFEKSMTLSPSGPRAPAARELAARVDKAIAAGGLTKLDAQQAKEDKAKPLPTASAPPFANAPFANTPFASAPFASGGGDATAAPALSKDVVDAIQNTQRTPELESGLAKLVEEGEDHLAHGRYQEALDVYKRVVPFQPDNARAKAGMAWALVGLGKPMADRVWTVAVQSDPSAVDRLGDTLKAKSDVNGAKALWTKLSQTAPDYAARAGLQSKVQ